VAVHVAFCASDLAGALLNDCGLDGGLGGVVQPATLAVALLLVGADVTGADAVEPDVAPPDAAELEPPEPWLSQTEMPTTAPIQTRTTSATTRAVDLEACWRLSSGFLGRLVFDMRVP
jgi:hypothetical protein